ncbi:AsmA-like C-terminal region-containing protein [Robiginitalea marina]|uniref:AsmA-like C-terminal region-containing protein n=1 Tax=Robiginitalea marina TaxID=2954105 RepID=A0ABT1AXE8_9FLAO|nr:AsmA-like C-terminal region-containing protein [Robiginitalea marina]MCO5724671.1 AsmA-like C-terminal region-containing protein [Robiginitalea marina]
MKRKKWLIIFGVVLGTLLLLPLGLGMYLEARIGPILRERAAQSIRGTFDFSRASLSLLRNFPRASVRLEDIYLLTEAPFRGDTLLKVGSLDLTMDLSALFREAGTPMPVRELHVRGMDLRLKVDGEGQPNYLVAKESEGGDSDSGFSLDLQQYTFEKARISYADSATGMALLLEEVSHSGSGDLSSQTATLVTESEGLMSLDYAGTSYLTRNALRLEAVFGMDFETDTYTFRENRAWLNQMPLVFQGSLQLREEGQWLDLEFRTPDTDFRNLLALVPPAYSGNLEGVETRGSFELGGTVKGLWSDMGIPAFELRMAARNGAFHYPGLPRWVEQVEIDAVLQNASGNPSETALQVRTASFAIGRDSFSLSGTAERLGPAAAVAGTLKGRIDLANLSQAYPLEGTPGLRGILEADLRTAFGMDAVRQKRYQDIQTSGSLDLSGVSWPLEGYAAPLEVQRAAIRFDPRNATLDPISGKLGQSDFVIRGAFTDYMPYLLGSGGVLGGQVTLVSEHLRVADFQGPEAEAEGEEAPFKIPSDVAVGLSATAGKVTYHDLELNQVSGELNISDGQMELRNFRSNAMQGLLALEGLLDTRGERPAFAMELGITRARIQSALESVELLQSLAPVAAALEGTFNSRIRLSGSLLEGFAPDLMSLGGEAAAEILAAGVSGGQAAVLEALASNLDFFDPKALDLKGLKTSLSFENGQVRVRPFRFNYKDIGVTVQGSHGFDRSLDYGLALEVPAHYLGSEVTRLLSELNQPELEDAPVPVNVRLSGTFAAPRLQTDLKASAAAFAGQLVEVQKQRLLTTGTSKAQELIGDLLKGKADSSQARTGVDGLSEVLKGVVQPGASDTAVAAPANTGEKARTLLKNLLGRRKDTVNQPKDSLPRNR